MEVPNALAASAIRLAFDINADALLIFTESGSNCQTIIEQDLATRSRTEKPKIVVATSSREAYNRLKKIHDFSIIKLAVRHSDKEDQIKHTIAYGMREGIFSPRQKLVCLTGDSFSDEPDTILVREVMGFEATLATMESDPVLAAVIEMATELGYGGPNREPIGSAFVVGDSREVMGHSYQLMLNPFRGHSLIITDRGNWQTIKKFASFDGAFIVDHGGRIISAARYLDANVKVDIPRGLGTRHLSVAAMTAVTKATGVTISGENGVVRIFKRGKLGAKIDPTSRVLSTW